MKQSRLSNCAKTILLGLLVLTSGLFVASATLRRVSATTPTFTFNNFELAGNPFDTTSMPPYGVGVSCPNSNHNCINNAGEPQIRADNAGRFYGSSENVICVIGGQCGGTFAWSSTDGGNHFTTLPLPNSISECGTAYQPIAPNADVCLNGGVGYSPAGGDTDIAVAPRTNENGLYNVYVASLASARTGLVNVFVSSSRDGGKTWFINPTSASLPIDDREWIAADGVNKVCISYHDVALTNHIFVNCSYDGGQTFTQLGDAFDSTHQFFGAFNNFLGNIAIDPRNHVIYQSFVGIGSASDLTQCNNIVGDCLHAVWVARSIDGGKTFSDLPVYINPLLTTTYDHQFPSIAIDKAGVVYAAFTDNHNVYYSFSLDFGNSWTGPRQVNPTTPNTAIFPWITAGNTGQIDIVWYGTSFYDGVTIPDNYPGPNCPTSPCAAWQVYFAQNLKAISTTSSFTVATASGIIHYGGVCESGATCTGNRDLLDDFGVAASPTTGLAAIIYTDDQLANTPSEPQQPRCVTNNTVRCTHTDIAVQTGGTGINQKVGEFEVGEEDFEETNLGGNNGQQPEFDMQVTNTGDVAINSLSAQISGLPLSFGWKTAFPLQPGQTGSASTTSIPLGIVLAIGNIYQVTITASRADGTTETQTTNAIYTFGAGLGL